MGELTRTTKEQDEALRINMEGNRLGNRGDLLGAKQKYEEALTLDPQNAITKSNLEGVIEDLEKVQTGTAVEPKTQAAQDVEALHNWETGAPDTNINLTPEQVGDLVVWLNVTLRDKRLKQNYAERLHNLFVQLTGRNHDVWDEIGGKYYPEDK